MRRLVLILILCGLGFAFYAYLYQPYISPFVDLYRQSGQIAALNERVENQTAFSPPSDDLLSADQVERYLGVQQAISDQMSGRLDSLRIEFDRIQGDIQVIGGRVELAGIADSMHDLLNVVIEAKEAQVNALNQHDFSLDEYHWVRQQIYRAAEAPLPDRDLADIIAEFRRGRFNLDDLVPEERSSAEDVPDENRELVRAHVQALREHAGLAFMGL